MIKLVLIDLDGTLLHDDKTIPKDFFDVYNQLAKQNIRLGIATGRSYSSIKRDFEVIAKQGVVIVEGGSCVFNNGDVINKQVIKSQDVDEVIDQIKEEPDCFAIVCHERIAYANYSKDKNYQKQLDTYYPSHQFIDDLHEVNKGAIKVTIYDELESTTHAYEILKYLKNKVQVTPGASDWVDVNVLNVNKGKGLDELLEYLKLTYDEVMIFGDYYNDLPMLEKVKNSYAVSNAPLEIKEACNYQCLSNNEDGVILKLKEVFNLD